MHITINGSYIIGIASTIQEVICFSNAWAL